MKIKIGDKVKLKNDMIAKIVSINNFREPSMRYGADIDNFYDVQFFGDEMIEEVLENKE